MSNSSSGPKGPPILNSDILVLVVPLLMDSYIEDCLNDRERRPRPLMKYLNVSKTFSGEVLLYYRKNPITVSNATIRRFLDATLPDGLIPHIPLSSYNNDTAIEYPIHFLGLSENTVIEGLLNGKSLATSLKARSGTFLTTFQFSGPTCPDVYDPNPFQLNMKHHGYACARCMFADVITIFAETISEVHIVPIDETILSCTRPIPSVSATRLRILELRATSIMNATEIPSYLFRDPLDIGVLCLHFGVYESEVHQLNKLEILASSKFRSFREIQLPGCRFVCYVWGITPAGFQVACPYRKGGAIGYYSEPEPVFDAAGSGYFD
ncbi:hypothetical protein TWF281_007861 [Arthrobotrys megalospora]